MSDKCECDQLRAENAALRQQAREAEVEANQMLAIMEAVREICNFHGSKCRTSQIDACDCRMDGLREDLADYQDSQQGRQA